MTVPALQNEREGPARHRTLFDRRSPQRSDERRARLLAALDQLLRTRPLADINIADLTERAGVTRSAFYFYFDNKATAAAALGAEMSTIALKAITAVCDVDEPPRARFETQIRGLVATLEQLRHLHRAVLDARQTNSKLRERWDENRRVMAGPVAAMIDAERAAGRAPVGPDSRALATILLEVNDLAVERLALGDPLPVEDRIDALVTVWLRTIYGTSEL